MASAISYLLISNTIDRFLFNIVGICLSLYALHVENRKERDPDYTAFCDFSQRFSCSKVLTSKYGRGFGLVSVLVGEKHMLNMRNCTLGVIFYTSQIVLGLYGSPLCVQLMYYSGTISILGSVYLAFILFFVLQDLCLLCVSTYIVNSALLYLDHALYYKY